MASEDVHFLMREDVPDDMKKAHKLWVDAVFYPESSRYLASLEEGPALHMTIVRDAQGGSAPAMLLLARRAEQEGRAQSEWYWLWHAVEAGSAEAAFRFGAICEEAQDKAKAFALYRTAQERHHVGVNWALANLCRASIAVELGVSQDELDAVLKASMERADAALNAEVSQALRTGAHPVQFLNSIGIPWGTGTFFIALWKGHHLAFTARHVLSASGASPEEANFLVPDYAAPMPFCGFFGVATADVPSSLDAPDVAVWELDVEAAGSRVSWQAWRLDYLWKPASILQPGARIFIVGYPNTEEAVDLDSNRLRRTPLIVRGILSEDKLGTGLYTVDCAEFSVDPDGVSGGPAFAQFGGIFHYVGMVLQGGDTARKLHFLDAAQVIEVLDRAVEAAASRQAST
ncbi:hypothetical protein [Cupriavidus oxalaticus]|uniref:Serine protease n=1 Tax=Cupriavidus oxalaticus TaxID=96344 RepID=A0A5P3VCK9_9BURK|nr:hypothetical protein [Cupriavidus oxalaticus]QEZ44124.1 serine protease [Cupriavidus oxalaticus]